VKVSPIGLRMLKTTKTLQLLTLTLISTIFLGCGAIKVSPVEEGDSLRYHARVGYFLLPPERKISRYIVELKKYADNKSFKRCEPSSIIRIHERFEKRYVEIQQDEKHFLFDTIGGRPILLSDGKYQLLDKYFRKDFPLPTEKVRRLGRLFKKSDLLCEHKVWVGMSKGEFLIARPPAHNIIKSIKGKKKIEKWQYETEDHVLKEYLFIDDELQKHNDI
jgi:hypothetical protein